MPTSPRSAVPRRPMPHREREASLEAAVSGGSFGQSLSYHEARSGSRANVIFNRVLCKQEHVASYRYCTCSSYKREQVHRRRKRSGSPLRTSNYHIRVVACQKLDGKMVPNLPAHNLEYLEHRKKGEANVHAHDTPERAEQLGRVEHRLLGYLLASHRLEVHNDLGKVLEVDIQLASVEGNLVLPGWPASHRYGFIVADDATLWRTIAFMYSIRGAKHDLANTLPGGHLSRVADDYPRLLGLGLLLLLLLLVVQVNGRQALRRALVASARV